jgi:hypothetical protein
MGDDGVVWRRRIVDDDARIGGHGIAVGRRCTYDLDAVIDIVRDAVTRVHASK